MKILDRFIIYPIAERIASILKRSLIKDMAWDVFSTLGISELENIIKQAKTNQKEVGHNDYTNLGKVYEERLRGMAIERLQKVLSDLTNEPLVSIKKDEIK